MRILALDLGASGGRALTGSLSGGPGARTLAVEVVHRFDHHPVWVPHARGRTLHWDVLHQWEEIQAGVRAAAAGGTLSSIGVDTWGVDFALLGRSGELIANPVAYRDPRTDGMVEMAWNAVGREWIFERTGLQFMGLNTLFQVMALDRSGSLDLRLADRLLFIPDLFHFWLSGRAAAEFTIASTSQMLQASTRDWDRELLQRLGLRLDCLAEVVEAGTVLGGLLPSVAEETGARSGTPIVCPASHDTASAVVATPGVGEDWAFLSAGTWCLFGAEISRALVHPEVLEAGFGNEGGVRGTTRLLRNITGLWLVQECRRYWLEQGREYSYAELAELATQAPPFVSLLDPDDPVFSPPSRMPETMGSYFRRTGQTELGDPGALVRAALEGIALTVRLRWEQLQSLLGRRLSVLHLVGGGSQNQLLCQFIANAIHQPVVAGPTEATAIGNMLTQAVGLGEMDFDEARAVVRRSTPLREYAPSDGQAWDDAYHRFRALRG